MIRLSIEIIIRAALSFFLQLLSTVALYAFEVFIMKMIAIETNESAEKKSEMKTNKINVVSASAHMQNEKLSEKNENRKKSVSIARFILV